ncbi:MAG: hypothetical protein HF962_07290 [Sulfurovum sp.]|nr:hypothetical protein [Sulfurovum sp.]
MKKKLKLAGVLLGTTLITATAAMAGSGSSKCGAGSCGDKGPKKKTEKAKDSKCGAGSCGGDKNTSKAMDGNKTKEMIKQAGKSTDKKAGSGK